jgi:hypothetical protein
MIMIDFPPRKCVSEDKSQAITEASQVGTLTLEWTAQL